MDLCSPWRHPFAKTRSKPWKRPDREFSPELRARLVAEQHGLCKICTAPFTETGYMTPQVDHDHRTGEVRGALCRDCNAGLGRYEANAEQRAAFERYLAR